MLNENVQNESEQKKVSTPKSGPDRRQLLSALAVGAGAIGFNRLAGAATDDSGHVTQSAAFGIGEGKADEAISFVEELCAAVEKNEPGVLVYIAHRSSEDPSRLFFFEVYENEEAVKAHGQQPHLAKMGQAFQAGVFTGPVEIVKLDKLAGYAR